MSPPDKFNIVQTEKPVNIGFANGTNVPIQGVASPKVQITCLA